MLLFCQLNHQDLPSISSKILPLQTNPSGSVSLPTNPSPLIPPSNPCQTTNMWISVSSSNWTKLYWKLVVCFEINGNACSFPKQKRISYFRLGSITKKENFYRNNSGFEIRKISVYLRGQMSFFYLFIFLSDLPDIYILDKSDIIFRCIFQRQVSTNS